MIEEKIWFLLWLLYCPILVNSLFFSIWCIHKANSPQFKKKTQNRGNVFDTALSNTSVQVFALNLEFCGKTQQLIIFDYRRQAVYRLQTNWSFLFTSLNESWTGDLLLKKLNVLTIRLCSRCTFLNQLHTTSCN